MYDVRFEGSANGEWTIFWGDRVTPVGYVRRLTKGGWFGKIAIDGHKAGLRAGDAQRVITALEAWVAGGLPADLELRWDRDKVKLAFGCEVQLDI